MADKEPQQDTGALGNEQESQREIGYTRGKRGDDQSLLKPPLHYSEQTKASWNTLYRITTKQCDLYFYFCLMTGDAIRSHHDSSLYNTMV
jgi:hypothetical protein